MTACCQCRTYMKGKVETDYSKMLIADNIVQSQMAGGDLLFNVSGQSIVIKKIYFRFEDSFECEIPMEESCKKYLLPKLTIQPLIENSFQHEIGGAIWHYRSCGLISRT